MAAFFLPYILTKDGSLTYKSEQFTERYHSLFGAISESTHVFIKNGLQFYKNKTPHVDCIRVLEMGTGTGLNLYLALDWCKQNEVYLDYTGIEAYPLSEQEIYPGIDWGDFQKDVKTLFSKGLAENIGNYNLKLHVSLLEEWEFRESYDVIFFDAFSPRIQPELWTPEMFTKLKNCLVKGGILSTYCAMGQVRRNMLEGGFKVEKADGPPGKREMLIGINH